MSSPCPLCQRAIPEGYSVSLCPACALSNVQAPVLSHIGAYEIVEPLGRGGMGVVYLACHSPSGRMVALKVPGADPEPIRRFRVEIEAVAALDHPHILPIYEVGEHERLPFYTMKFAEGGSLADRLADYRAPEKAARLLCDVADAVAHAHTRGILHRDLKPQNILLDAQGRVFVSDFGLARWLHRSSDATHSLQMLGTPDYLAPEQISESSALLTTSADIFSLGAILHHLLAGQPPFHRETVGATLKSVVEDSPPPLRSIVPGLSRDLEIICEKCLAHEPGHRYATAAQLAADLRHWLAGEVISIRRVGTPERIVRWCRRNPRLALAGGLAGLSLLAGGTAALISIRQALIAETGRADAAEQLSRALRKSSLLNDARQLTASGRAGQRSEALRLLQDAWKLAPSLEIRNAAIVALTLPDLAELPSIPFRSVCPGQKVALAQDGSRFAIVPSPKTIEVHLLPDGREEKFLSPGTDSVEGLVGFDPEGKLLAARMGPDRLVVWDLATGKAFPPLNLAPAQPRAGWDVCSFLPGRRMVIVAPDGTLQLVNLDNDHRAPLGGAIRPNAVGSSPDGKFVATVFAKECRVEVHDLSRGTIQYAAFPKEIESFAWSADGEDLVVACLDKHLYTWSRQTSIVARRASTRESTTRQLVFGADGLAATVALDHAIRLWDADYPDDRLVETASVDSSEPVSWTSDGSRLYAVDEKNSSLLVWEVSHPSAARLFQPPLPEETFEGVSSISLHPNGRMASAVTEAGVRIWDLQTGRPTAFLPKVRDEWMGTAFSANGDALYVAGWNSWVMRYPFDGRILGSPLKLSFDNGYVLAGRSTDGSTIALLSNAEGESQFALWRDGNSVQIPYLSPFAIALSPDGSRVATSAYNRPGLQIRDGADGHVVRDLETGVATRAAFHPDGRGLLLAHGQTISEWDASTGDLHRSLELDALVRSVAYRPGGQLIAVERSRDIALVSPRSWSVVALLPTPGSGRGSTNRSFSFSEDGRKLVAQTSEGGLMVWQLDELVRELDKLGLGWR